MPISTPAIRAPACAIFPPACSPAASPGDSSPFPPPSSCSPPHASNPLCLRLAPLALAVVFCYSFTKRFTSFSHLVLGFSLGIAPAAAWIAVAGSLDPRILWLTAAVTFWTAGFDVIYACQDYEFDCAEALASVPRLLGISGALWVSAFSAPAHGYLPASSGSLALARLPGACRSRRRRGAARLRAQPGPRARSLARRRRLLHHERLGERVILYILGRRYLPASSRAFDHMPVLFEDPRLRPDPRKGRSRRAARLSTTA